MTSSCVYCNISNSFLSTPPTSTNNACDGFILSSVTSNYPIISYTCLNSLGNIVGTNSFIFIACNDLYVLTIVDNAGCILSDTLTLGNISGCTDSTALNYNPLLTNDDGSCLYPTLYGCTDSLAINYDSLPNTDDGSCIYCDLSISQIYIVQNSTPDTCDGWGGINKYTEFIFFTHIFGVMDLHLTCLSTYVLEPIL